MAASRGMGTHVALGPNGIGFSMNMRRKAECTAPPSIPPSSAVVGPPAAQLAGLSPALCPASTSGRGGARGVAVAAEIDWSEWYPEPAKPASTPAPPKPAADGLAPSENGGDHDPQPLRMPPSRPRSQFRSQPVDPPVTLYQKTFQDAKSCQAYYANLRKNTPRFTDLEEFEHNMVFALLREGHPRAKEKIGPGIVAFQVRPITVRKQETNAFFMLRQDGTFDDFSTRKCMVKLFPNAMKGEAYRIKQ